jgi:peptide/nickel transport system ATP-binding protein
MTGQPAPAAGPLLEVRGLCTEFRTEAGIVRPVDDVSFDVAAGAVLGVVGESGSGKSVTALSVMGLVARPGRIAAGSIRLAGVGDLTRQPPAALRRQRGDSIAMIFQEPMTSLNPVFRVGWQIAEAVRQHRDIGRAAARDHAVAMLDRVGIPSPQSRARDFPHQLSGGMRQRVMIAMAMACRPRLLLADEPTTALDVTVQAQILDLMRKMQSDEGTAILLITHDMGVIAEMAHSVVVMYAGQVVEQAGVDALFEAPLHPYTRGLLNSIPRGKGRGQPLQAIPGLVPSLSDLPGGCRFRDRCPAAMAVCARAEPPLMAMRDGRKVRCWLHEAGGSA